MLKNVLIKFLICLTALIGATAIHAETPSVSNADISFAWPMGTTTPALTATQSIDGLFSVVELSIGTGLTISKVATPNGGNQFTLFKASTVNAANPVAADALTFTVIPRAGVAFKPTEFSFKVSKFGTNGGKVTVDAKRGVTATTLCKDLGMARNSDAVGYSSITKTISNFDASSDPFTVTIYLQSLGANKEMGFADVMLKGIADGQVVELPVYNLSLATNLEGAGTVSVAPTGDKFDKGTQLKVTATENFGYHFQHWADGNGNNVSTDNPYTFNIDDNTSLTAIYTANPVYALNLTLEGGANPNLVSFTPTGHMVNGVHYYEAGTEVRLETANNRILTFSNWEDSSTSPVRDVKMDGEKNFTATFSAADYIVGWDFYLDQPSSERAADYKAESDNAGLFSLRNVAGTTSSWLTRGVGNGSENGKWGARVWRKLSDEYYFEASCSTLGYTNIAVAASLGVSFNTYSTVEMQWSADGVNFQSVGVYTLPSSGWVSHEYALPAEASNLPRIWVRFFPDRTSKLVGSATDYDGLAIADLYIMGEGANASDDLAPQLVSAIPANGTDNVTSTGSIILTFNEKIKVDDTAAKATLNGEKLAAIASGKSVIFNYTGLSYNTDYTFTLPAALVTDRSGNPYEGTTIAFRTMERSQPSAHLFDAVVGKDNTADYSTLQEAIDAAPAGRVKPWLILVKNGEYKGHVEIPADKPFMHIIGQDRDKTVICDDLLCGGDNALHVSVGATVVVKANDCFFENITLENSFGHRNQSGPQALALNTMADRTVFNNVAMLSYQDTWITPTTSAYRAYVRNSLIEGAVDFIYNSGDIFIDNTTLLINRKSGGFIVAPSHADDVKWGYVFNNCTITAPGVPSETSVWLGRPWHNSPKTVFLNTRAEVTIPATGWYETMGGLPVLWADYNTVDANGKLLDLSQRRDTYYKMVDGVKVYGKAKNFLTAEEAAQYTVRNVLSGSDKWNPVVLTESCTAPAVTCKDGVISWNKVDYAISYLVICNNEIVANTTDCSYSIGSLPANEFEVRAVNEFGGLSAKARVSDTPTALGTIAIEGKSEYFDIYGHSFSSPQRGMNIVRTTNEDGSVSVRKMVL